MRDDFGQGGDVDVTWRYLLVCVDLLYTKFHGVSKNTTTFS